MRVYQMGPESAAGCLVACTPRLNPTWYHNCDVTCQVEQSEAGCSLPEAGIAILAII